MRPATSSGRISSCAASAIVMAIDDEAGSGGSGALADEAEAADAAEGWNKALEAEEEEEEEAVGDTA